MTNKSAPDSLTLRRPDDWHLHLREGVMLGAVLPFTAARFGRAIVMPNLAPPVTTIARACAYRAEILAALPEGSAFTPLMTCYLTDDTDPEEVARGAAEHVFTAVKLYPAHATTNSAHGVTDLHHCRPVLERMQAIGLPLLVHGEVTEPTVDIFDREAVFLERVLAPLLAEFPALKVVLEHVTTAEAVAFVRAHGPGNRLAATLTAHHLLINRNAMFEGGLRPHHYCLPVAKREAHRLALVDAATSGEPWFFLGTDSAPHSRWRKEAACGCAGVFSAPAALELYAEAFDQAGRLDRLEAFASLNGPRFYGLPVNTDTVTLIRRPHGIPVDIGLDRVPIKPGSPFCECDVIIPFRAGQTAAWSMTDGHAGDDPLVQSDSEPVPQV